MSVRHFCLAIASLLFTLPASAARLEILDADNYDLIASTSRGLRLRIKQPEMLFRVGGRVHGDAGGWDRDDTGTDSRIRLRRGRVYLSGRIADDFRFRIEREFAPASPEFKNLFVQYRPTGRGGITIGNFVAPFGLEQIMSSNHLTFMERDVSGSLGPGFQTGARVDFNGSLANRRGHHRFTLALAGGVEPLGQVSNDLHRSEHVSAVARLTYAPVARRKRVVHFGLAGEYRELLDDSTYTVFARPESGLLRPRYLGTLTGPGLNSVDSVASLGVEAAVMKGPLLFQGEYHRSELKAGGALSDPSFHGGYLQGSWVVTGEHREYNRNLAMFGGLDPDSDWGAIELAARLSGVDLEDGGVAGGRAIDVTAGVNWYLRSNLRLMFNYIHSEADTRLTSDSLGVDIYQARVQLHF